MTMAASAKPYRSTAIFDAETLPAALRRRHTTKAGVWARIEVLKGQVRYEIFDPPSVEILEPGRPGRVAPEQPHQVLPCGPMQMRVDFYDCDPDDT